MLIFDITQKIMLNNLNRRVPGSVEDNKYRKYIKKYIIHLARKTSFITSALREIFLLGGMSSIFD